MTQMTVEKSEKEIVLSSDEQINLVSAVPFYLQLTQHLEQKIKNGEWQPGWKMPSEQTLCDHFKVSRTVVRQSLNALSNANLVVKYKGKGSYITRPLLAWQLMQTLSGFHDDAVGRGKKINTEVLELTEIKASQEISELLQIPEGEPVVKLNRLRFLDDEPVVVVETYIPKKICPSLLSEEFTDKSLYGILREKYGLFITDGVRTIESINASPHNAKLLGVPVGAALTKLTSVGYLNTGIPLEYFIAWHRGDRSRFQVRLTTRIV